jgi:dolichyl-phosphate-mannose-protein mannosyltransferase
MPGKALATERHTIERPRIRAALGGHLPILVLATGVALGACSMIVYRNSGYGRPMLLLWLGGLVALSAYFWSRSPTLPRIAAVDLVVSGLLILVFAPLYLAAVYRWPVQVGSDEQAIMMVSRQYAHTDGADPFGMSTYFGRPTLLFLFWGRAGELLGGVHLYEMRLLHALFGLILIGAAYALFRQLLPRPWAIFAAFLLGSSHALFMISRMAMRENTAVLVEVVAFALLLWGLRHNHAFATFCGGLVAGLGYYVYFPARATFPLWLIFLVAVGLLFREGFPARNLVRLGSISAAGFALMAGPIVIAESKLPAGSLSPQRETLLVYPEARTIQKGWVFASSEGEAIRTNIKWGLTTFNNTVVDHGWIYENHGHGFVDPLTGIFLWIGVAVVGWRLARRRADPRPLLALTGFLVLWLSFAFLVNKAPNYTRLLITLPFVAYLVTEAVRAIGERVRSRYGTPRAATGVVLCAAAVIAVWNLAIAWDFVQKGRRFGDPIGSTGRYVESHRNIPGEKFYISTDQQDWKYFAWGNPRERVGLFAGDAVVGEVVPPDALASFRAAPPFAIFMRGDLWAHAGSSLARHYPQGRVRDITPDGRLVVLEVPRPA